MQERKDSETDKSDGAEMETEKLEQTFRWKITAEMRLFRERAMQMEKGEIFADAYRIDCTIRIYEILMELSAKLGKPGLEGCINMGSLLDFLYESWLKEPDSQEEELEHSLCSIINGIATGLGKNCEKQRKAG